MMMIMIMIVVKTHGLAFRSCEAIYCIFRALALKQCVRVRVCVCPCPSVQRVAQMLWSQLDTERREQHISCVELFYRLHCLTPSANVCEDIICQALLHKNKVEYTHTLHQSYATNCCDRILGCM